MAIFDIAHINEQGEDLILVPLKSEFGYKSELEKQKTVEALQDYANKQGLKGFVIPVWMDVVGRMNFVAPEFYHPYLLSINYNYVMQNLNKKLICD